VDYKDITIKEIEYEKRLLKQYEIKLKRLPTGKLVCLRKKRKRRILLYRCERQKA